MVSNGVKLGSLEIRRFMQKILVVFSKVLLLLLKNNSPTVNVLALYCPTYYL